MTRPPPHHRPPPSALERHQERGRRAPSLTPNPLHTSGSPAVDNFAQQFCMVLCCIWLSHFPGQGYSYSNRSKVQVCQEVQVMRCRCSRRRGRRLAMLVRHIKTIASAHCETPNPMALWRTSYSHNIHCNHTHPHHAPISCSGWCNFGGDYKKPDKNPV